MSFTVESCISIFNACIEEYHKVNSVDTPCPQIYSAKFDQLLFRKCWVDTVQWHLEDMIRDPNIEPEKAVALKRRIDLSNQNRTDLVEDIDDYFFEAYKNVKVIPNPRLATETPAWAIDRLSILCLKIYHFKEEVLRPSEDEQHKKRCKIKLNTLKNQQAHLSLAIAHLLKEASEGICQIHTYKQMKMYNDETLNPVLRK